VIVSQFNVVSAAVAPLEADSVLVINSNTVLSFTAAFGSELFQAVAWWHPQIVDVLRGVEELHLPASRLRQFLADPLRAAELLPDPLGVAVAERPDHTPNANEIR